MQIVWKYLHAEHFNKTIYFRCILPNVYSHCSKLQLHDLTNATSSYKTSYQTLCSSVWRHKLYGALARNYYNCSLQTFANSHQLCIQYTNQN